MRMFMFILALSILMVSCKAEKKPETKTVEETAEDSLPENIGDKNAPTAIKALKGAKEVKKRMDTRRDEDSKVLEESN